LDLLEALRAAGSDLNFADECGETPLHWAVNENTPQNVEVVRWAYTYKHIHTHTHTYIYIYKYVYNIYIYMLHMCVCIIDLGGL
jgi:hypothetical protein